MNPIPRIIDSQLARQIQHRAFRGTVGACAAAYAGFAEHARDVDDVAAVGLAGFGVVWR